MDPTLTGRRPTTASGPSARGAGLVAVGGAVGTLARYALDAAIGGVAVGGVAGLPLGVFVINVTGAFALGVLLQALTRGGPDRGRRRDLRLLLGTGLLGGYTTYSLLAGDVAVLLLDHRITAAVGYGLATIVVGGLAGWAGILTARLRGSGR